jgi:hypothetical protein
VFLAGTSILNPNVPSWSYLSSYDHGTPILGTLHGSDIIQVFYGIKDNYAARSIRTYYTNFVYNLDPNVGVSGKYPNWPKWSQGNNLAHFLADKSELIKDNFRQASFEWITNNMGVLRF